MGAGGEVEGGGVLVDDPEVQSMYRNLLPGLMLLVAPGVRAELASGTFTFKTATPVTLMAQTIASTGGFNVVCDPAIFQVGTFELAEVAAVDALRTLAGMHALHVTQVTYASRETYLLTATPRDASRMVLTGENPGSTSAVFTFKRPTPLQDIVHTMATIGGVKARCKDSATVVMSLQIQGLSGVESLHVVAHALGLEVSLEGDVYVISKGTPVRSALPLVPLGPVPGIVPQGPTSPTGPGPAPAPPGAPVTFNVMAISGNEPDFVAVIEYRQETYIVQPGSKIPDEYTTDFEVRAISPDWVEVFDPRIQRIVRRRFIH